MIPADATATLSGTVTLREGDCFPPTSPDTCHVSTPSRTVYLFPIQRVTGDDIIPSTIDVAPVARTQSDDHGRYSMSAPPGRWSVFVEDLGHVYGEGYESNTGEIDAVELSEGVVTNFDILINHATE